MTAPEFSRPVKIDTVGTAAQTLAIEADKDELIALAKRFGLVAIAALCARITLSGQGDEIHAEGTLQAAVTQSCVATGAPVDANVEAQFELVFRPQSTNGDRDEEIELHEGELDTIFYEGGAIDIGEAVAETLLLNLDSYPRAAGAEDALRAAGVRDENEAGPFAALAGLRDKLKT